MYQPKQWQMVKPLGWLMIGLVVGGVGMHMNDQFMQSHSLHYHAPIIFQIPISIETTRAIKQVTIASASATTPPEIKKAFGLP